MKPDTGGLAVREPPEMQGHRAGLVALGDWRVAGAERENTDGSENARDEQKAPAVDGGGGCKASELQEKPLNCSFQGTGGSVSEEEGSVYLGIPGKGIKELLELRIQNFWFQNLVCSLKQIFTDLEMQNHFKKSLHCIENNTFYMMFWTKQLLIKKTILKLVFLCKWWHTNRMHKKAFWIIHNHKVQVTGQVTGKVLGEHQHPITRLTSNVNSQETDLYEGLTFQGKMFCENHLQMN